MSTPPPAEPPDQGFAPPSPAVFPPPSAYPTPPAFQAPPPAYQVQPTYQPQPAYQIPPPVYLTPVYAPVPEGDQPVPLGHRRTPAAWLIVTVVLAALFSLVAPAVSDSMIQNRQVEPGEEFGLLTGGIAAVEGWDVSVPDAAVGSPTLTQGGVEVAVFTGFWQGDTEDLIDRALSWMVDQRVPVTDATAQEGLATQGRDVFRVDIDGTEGRGALFVIREEAAVAVVAVSSDSRAPWSQSLEQDIEAMVDSVWLEPSPLLYAEETP